MRNLLVPLTCLAASAFSFHADADASKIHLNTFCTSPGVSDDSDCIREWIKKGSQNPQKTLYADAGTYLYHAIMPVYSGLKLECDDPARTTFRNIPKIGASVSGGVFLSADSTVNDVRVEKCAFDVNGNDTDFLAVIDISPDYPDASTNIVVRRNRIYDGKRPGKTSKCQRQYILLINCHYCRVENNHLSEGGRIKVGQPGEHLRVVGDTVDDANDNAITVVDVNNTLSFDIVIERNLVRKPKGIGIYLGSDGDTLNRPLMTTNDVRVEANRVEGDWTLACIFARLPAKSQKIRILGNTCIKTGTGVQSSAGIRVKRTDDAVSPSCDIRIEHNRLEGAPMVSGALDAGIFFSGAHDNVKVSNNQIVNVGLRAMLFEGEVTHATIVGNTIGAARIQIAGHIQGQVQQPHEVTETGSVTQVSLSTPCS